MPAELLIVLPGKHHQRKALDPLWPALELILEMHQVGDDSVVTCQATRRRTQSTHQTFDDLVGDLGDSAEEAERLAAELQTSRSQLYSRALQEFVARHAPDRLTEAMNRRQ